MQRAYPAIDLKTETPEGDRVKIAHIPKTAAHSLRTIVILLYSQAPVRAIED